MSTLLEYKCPRCAGKIEFDSKLQKMKCPFCSTEFEVDTLKSYDDVLKQEKPDDMSRVENAGGEWADGETEGLSVFLCNSCGGEIVADATTAASACPFCDNPVIMTGRLSGDIRPDLVIPFKFDKDAAKEALKRHFKGKPLLPKAFKDENHIDEIKGLYVPFWLFDADADADIRYRATKIRTWSDRNYINTETSYFAVFRGGKIRFANVPVDGSTKMANELMESIEPFDIKGAVDFQTAYLSGYLADRYDVDSNDSIERANERMKKSTQNSFAGTVQGYSSVTAENTSIRLDNGKVKYALYPVWILNTNWKDKKFTFAMNGQTGKLVGNLPTDYSAYFKWLLSLTAVFGALAFLVYALYLMS